ncbi:MAG: hypothetical protein H6510_05920 [Acidobacteria bacterium]|nr:hypothetical protein [Acidobacteriota bacterium]MCB9397331.1 hypothetical protein [Acidobacteriota bacterium]
MQNLPLHPLFVHLPLILAVLAPFSLFGLWRMNRLQNQKWTRWILIGYCALLFGSSFLAMRLGEADEERVESIVTEQVIENHEQWGSALTWSAGILLVFAIGLLMKPQHNALWAGLVLFSFVPAVFTVLAGHSGAQLVYQHGAGQAYASTQNTPGAQLEQEDDD